MGDLAGHWLNHGASLQIARDRSGPTAVRTFEHRLLTDVFLEAAHYDVRAGSESVRPVDSFPRTEGLLSWTGGAKVVETKFLRLYRPVELGAEIDGWRVSWVGGWGKNRLFYFVMVIRVKA